MSAQSDLKWHMYICDLSMPGIALIHPRHWMAWQLLLAHPAARPSKRCGREEMREVPKGPSRNQGVRGSGIVAQIHLPTCTGIPGRA